MPDATRLGNRKPSFIGIHPGAATQAVGVAALLASGAFIIEARISRPRCSRSEDGENLDFEIWRIQRLSP